MLSFVGEGSEPRAEGVVEQTLMDCLAQFPWQHTTVKIENTRYFVNAQTLSLMKFDNSCLDKSVASLILHAVLNAPALLATGNCPRMT